MADVDREILEQTLAGSQEPVMVVRTDQPDWPVALVNPAFQAIGGDDAEGKPFADVIEAIGGRDLALDVSECVRSGEATSFPVDTGSREYLLALRPLLTPDVPPSPSSSTKPANPVRSVSCGQARVAIANSPPP